MSGMDEWGDGAEGIVDAKETGIVLVWVEEWDCR